MSLHNCLWTNLRLATMDATSDMAYGAIENAALFIENGKIAWLGKMDDMPANVANCENQQDGGNRWVTPGLIDCHTHIVYGGNRINEFEQRLTGVSYDEIARSGGGIVSTVQATREASEEELYESANKRLQNFLQEGVTALEVKSGYGLNLESELKMLRVAKQLEKNNSVKISTTFLGAHTTPKEYESSDDYIDYLCDEVMPIVAQEKLAHAVDIFCESIGFNLEQTDKIFSKAQELKLPIKAHVDQLTNLGGAQLAAHYNARSVDHVEFLDEQGVYALKGAGTVAVLLPGAFYFLRETQQPPIKLLREENVPMAIASDSNPGSSPVNSLLLMLNMACTFFKLTPEESLAGVTRHAAKALGWEKERGTLTVGKQADFVLWDIQQPAELAYNIGKNPCNTVVVNGKVVLTRGNVS